MANIYTQNLFTFLSFLLYSMSMHWNLTQHLLIIFKSFHGKQQQKKVFSEGFIDFGSKERNGLNIVSFLTSILTVIFQTPNNECC